MLNQVIIAGRLVRSPELRQSENKKNYSYITLAIPRSFKNQNGEYETDYIDCILWDSIAINACDYCKKGDVVAVRGRIQTRLVEMDDKKESKLDIICERLTFLANSSKQSENN